MAEGTEEPNGNAEKRSFKLGIDYEKNRLLVDLAGSLDFRDVSKLMAFLSHCQHVLVLSSAGQRLDLPIDPNVAFSLSPGDYSLGSNDTIVRYAVGIDEAVGMVGVTVLGASGRLSGYRIERDMARNLANSLLKAADKTPPPRQIRFNEPNFAHLPRSSPASRANVLGDSPFHLALT